MSDLPFLKNKNRKNEPTIVYQSNDPKPEHLLRHCAEEFLAAVEVRDIAGMREALKAIVLMIQDMDEEQDAADEEQE